MTKHEFIIHFLEVIRRKLEKELEDESFEYDFLREAWEILRREP